MNDLTSPESILSNHVLKLVVCKHDLIGVILEVSQGNILRLALSPLLLLLLMVQNTKSLALAKVVAIQHRAQLLLTLEQFDALVEAAYSEVNPAKKFRAVEIDSQMTVQLLDLVNLDYLRVDYLKLALETSFRSTETRLLILLFLLVLFEKFAAKISIVVFAVLILSPENALCLQLFCILLINNVKSK